MNGLNVGIRENGGIFVPLTMLIARNSNIEEYIETAVPSRFLRWEVWGEL